MKKQETNTMEKQDTPTTYVRITKCSIGNAWYADNIGITFPIRGLSRKRGFYETIEGSQISDLDCEVVALPHQPDGFYKKTIEAAQEILADYIDPDGPGTEVTINKLLEILDNRKLIEKIRNEKHLPALPEGQHLITTEHIKNIHKFSLATGQGYVEELFPEVFAPAKTTYRIGDRFSIAGSDYTYRIVHLFGNHIGLLCDESSAMHGDMLEVEDTLSITWGEMDELAECRFDEFTLLPESTDQTV